jgi:hypothetical protein
MEEFSPLITKHGKTLLQGLGKAEDQRKAGYVASLALQATKTALQRRELDRLSQKYGAQHPTVQRITAAIAHSAKLVKAIQMQQVRADNPVLPAAAGTCLVQGIVMNKEGKPQPGMTVSLFTTDKTWVRELGYACTDANGIFKLLITDKNALEQYAGSPLFLTATNDRQEVLCRDTAEMRIANGQTLVRHLVMDDRNCPPPVSREIARTGPPAAEPPVRSTDKRG